ncbi:DUF2628 domain-containing protein [Winogradskyella litoriviva]|uniref:DUF2628 domain-containing protein n=1 Tax=Winogradskyella litoriviva TaxID=1220182 RepID=A0ABX2E695_9FLAO|nr:DUF2628 domain-containing protein [Winogradskyella litoriviva]NRD23910.1 DUF2628 domain-containing protein [Winogradskyella litoriviva]
MLTEENKIYYENYFQSNADYYIEQTEKINNGKKFTFNIAAFFLGIFWMAYRKMYIHITIVFGIIYAEMLIEEMLLDFGVISYAAYEVIDFISMFIWSFLFATLSNGLYISKTKKDIKKILIENKDTKTQNELISKKGGVNSIAPVILLLILIALIFITNI